MIEMTIAEAQGIVDSQSDTREATEAIPWIDLLANAVAARLGYGDANESTETADHADMKDRAAEIIRQGLVKGVLNALANIPAREASGHYDRNHRGSPPTSP